MVSMLPNLVSRLIYFSDHLKSFFFFFFGGGGVVIYQFNALGMYT